MSVTFGALALFSASCVPGARHVLAHARDASMPLAKQLRLTFSDSVVRAIAGIERPRAIAASSSGSLLNSLASALCALHQQPAPTALVSRIRYRVATGAGADSATLENTGTWCAAQSTQTAARTWDAHVQVLTAEVRLGDRASGAEITAFVTSQIFDGDATSDKAEWRWQEALGWRLAAYSRRPLDSFPAERLPTLHRTPVAHPPI
jgi:hypothetical protein